MRIFWKKAVKSPQRRGLRPRTPIGLRQGFQYSSCFNIRKHLTPSQALTKLPHIQQELVKKNDSIFSFEQVICSGVASRGHVGAYTLGAGFWCARTHFAVK